MLTFKTTDLRLPPTPANFVFVPGSREAFAESNMLRARARVRHDAADEAYRAGNTDAAIRNACAAVMLEQEAERLLALPVAA